MSILLTGDQPTNIAIDEFRGPQGKYCFIIVDNDTSQIYQILPDRLKSSITHYFDRFSLKERKRVKSVSTDLNSYYQDLVRRYFPNAKLVCGSIPHRFNAYAGV
ncbi:transposase [Limosilactobacillus fermentum]|nr:transposase [Limosilactobacillus fermentum]UOG12885.1 transposase [Limosilactobacillus fermentum]